MLFEKAARLKLRFPSHKGQLSVEDLWLLPLKKDNAASLNTIAVETSKALKDSGEESFVEVKSAKDCVLQLKMDILKYIIKVRLEENLLAKDLVERKAKKQQILGLIADKQNDALAGKSEDELKKMLEDL